MFIQCDDPTAIPLEAGETRGAAIDLGAGRRGFSAPAGAHSEGDIVHLYGLKFLDGTEVGRNGGRRGWLKTDNGRWLVLYEASSPVLDDDRSFYVVARMDADATTHNPDPAYLRSLLHAAGLSQREAARRIGVSERMMRYYLADESADHRPAPYSVQFALESLVSPRLRKAP